MTDSILNSTKKVLGVTADYSAFDVDILMHINSVFATLNQIGIGPEAGFMIEDASATWEEYLGSNLRFNSVKTLMYLKVRQVFDPPQTSYLIEAINKQVDELTWRLSILREGYAWALPITQLTPEDIDYIVDGGNA